MEAKLKEKDLLAFSGSSLQGGIDKDGQDQKADSYNKIENHKISRKVIAAHYLTPLTTSKLEIQLTTISHIADIITGTSTLSSPKKKGTTTKAKRTSPILIRISETLSSWESVNSSFTKRHTNIFRNILSR